jgi:hypothetical protein
MSEYCKLDIPVLRTGGTALHLSKDLAVSPSPNKLGETTLLAKRPIRFPKSASLLAPRGLRLPYGRRSRRALPATRLLNFRACALKLASVRTFLPGLRRSNCLIKDFQNYNTPYQISASNPSARKFLGIPSNNGVRRSRFSRLAARSYPVDQIAWPVRV